MKLIKIKLTKTITSIVFVFFIFLLSACNLQHNKHGKPNILFIIADDLGYYDLSCTGSNYYETPNIDRIAREGMMFTEGYANCQVCSPSRASIMTGKFPARHGITDHLGARSGKEWRTWGRHSKLLPPEYLHNLPHEYMVLPEALKEAGYKTFMAGKWHLGIKGSWPTDHGFDINKGGWEVGSPRSGYFVPWKNPNLKDGPEGENLSLRLARETANFIKQNKDTSFFAYLSFYAVHGPVQTTKEKWSKYRQKAEDAGIAETGFKMGHFLPIRQEQDNPVYAGLVETMDDAVGIVLKALDETGLADNTIVIFTSDNGGVVSGDDYSTSNKPLRAGKGNQFEGGIKEPYFIKIPWMEGGCTCGTPVIGTDFYPTILELVGEKPKPDEHVDGVSLVPLLEGGTIAKRDLIWHYPHYGNQGGMPSSIIRSGNWKLIHYYEDDHEELYNLETDISETTDLSKDYQNLVQELNEQLFSFLKEVNARFPQKDPEYDEGEEKEYLKSIEYKRMPRLEKERLNFLSNKFDPGNNWWGSMVANGDSLAYEFSMD